MGSAFRDSAPGAARERPWVDAVGNDRAPRAKIVFRHGVGHLVSLTLDLIASPAQRLFDRVDPQVYRADRSRKLARDRRLADARQATEDDEAGVQ